MLHKPLFERVFHDRIIAVTVTHKCGGKTSVGRRPHNLFGILIPAPAYWVNPRVTVTSALASRMREFCIMSESNDWSARNGQAGKSARQRAWSLLAAGKIPTDDLKLKMDLQGWKCMYCKDVISLYTAEIDHIHPLSKGGDHYLYNIVLTCGICNRRKSNLYLKTFCKRMDFDYEAIKQEIADINHRLHILVFGENWRDWKPEDEQ